MQYVKSNTKYNSYSSSLRATAYRTLGTDEWSFKYYRYDARGRIIKMWNYIAGLEEKSIEYSYNSQNQITDMKYENAEPESKKFKYEYDYAGRLLNTSFDYIPSNSPDDYLTFNSYTYNQNSRINTFSFDPINLIYTSEYDTRNRITYFTSSKPNIFSYSLSYFANSNIQTQTFSGYYRDNFSNQYDLSFNYSYDESNRLLEANCTSTQDNTFDIINSYDPDGNLLTMQRYGSNNNLFDNYNYAYYTGTNRLRRVVGSTDLFTYDYNGNMTNDYMNNNTGIKYDHRNLITEITNQNIMVDPPRTYITRYRYDEAGNRTRKTVFLSEEYDPPPLPDDEADLPPGWTIIVDDYYSRDVSGKEIAVYSSYTLQYWNVWSGNEITGRINYAGNSKYYYLKDHLGSIRAVLDEGKTVISANDYDMWGYYLENRAYNTTNTKNKFTGKERDSETSYDYFGARYYDSRVGRWGATDPLFEKHIQFTPYNYVLGNPLILIDPDGKQTLAWELVKNATKQASQELLPWLGVPITPLGAVLSIITNPNSLGKFDIKESLIFERNDIGELVYIFPVEEIEVTPLQSKSGKIRGIESNLVKIEEHLEKLGGINPGEPDPRNNKNLWKAHIIKAIKESYKDFKQAYRNIKNRNFEEYLEKTFGKDRIRDIYDKLKEYDIDFRKIIK